MFCYSEAAYWEDSRMLTAELDAAVCVCSLLVAKCYWISFEFRLATLLVFGSTGGVHYSYLVAMGFVARCDKLYNSYGLICMALLY